MSLLKVAELLESAQSQINQATSILRYMMDLQSQIAVAPLPVIAEADRIMADSENTKVLPTYNELFEHVLRVVNKIGPSNYRVVAAHLVRDLGITMEQLRIVQPKHPEKPTFAFRVEWAMWYLSDSIESYPARGGHLHLDKTTLTYTITASGIDALVVGIDDDENRAIIARVNANSKMRADANRPARLARKVAKDSRRAAKLASKLSTKMVSAKGSQMNVVQIARQNRDLARKVVSIR